MCGSDEVVFCLFFCEHRGCSNLFSSVFSSQTKFVATRFVSMLNLMAVPRFSITIESVPSKFLRRLRKQNSLPSRNYFTILQ
jgi:hypothetical protein